MSCFAIRTERNEGSISRFDVSNTDHVISVHIGDRVSIKCPKSDGAGKYEYSYIYMVSDEEYDHCFLAKPRLVGACDNQTINVS